MTKFIYIHNAGVLVYEMLMASTPFVPKKADNVTELFTNIAMVTVSILIIFLIRFLFHTFMFLVGR